MTAVEWEEAASAAVARLRENHERRLESVAAKMAPEEFDRRGRERRQSRAARTRFTAGAAVFGIAALALWAFVIFNLVWGISPA